MFCCFADCAQDAGVSIERIGFNYFVNESVRDVITLSLFVCNQSEAYMTPRASADLSMSTLSSTTGHCSTTL
jgi:hypothetical protein